MSKGLVVLIKKMAEETVDAVPDPNALGAEPKRVIIPNKNIIAMQKALQSLAKNVLSSLKAEDMTKTDEKGTPTRESGAAMGRVSFNDFIVKNFLRQSDVEGIEYDTKSPKMSEKTPYTPTHMSLIMDTMKRIGGEKEEDFADGKWGPRTNAAVRNAYAFGFAMNNFAKKFGAGKEIAAIYSDNDLANFKSSLPENENSLTPQQKENEFAPAFTKHIIQINRMYNMIKSKIINNPENRSYIELDRPFVSYKKVVPLNQQDQALKRQLYTAWSKQRHTNNAFSITVNQPGREGGSLTANLNYTDLISPQSFNAWLNGPAGKELTQNRVEVSDILKAIRNSLEQKKSTSSAPTPAPTPEQSPNKGAV